jgi:hypothetical protein
MGLWGYYGLVIGTEEISYAVFFGLGECEADCAL